MIKKGDKLIWTEPNTRAKFPVEAASDERDGMIQIKNKETFAACPVEELELAESDEE